MNCGETSGFLFSHPCAREAEAQCNLCGKPVCALHARPTDGQIFCITCLKRYLADRVAAAPPPPGQPAPQEPPGPPAVAPGQPGAVPPPPLQQRPYSGSTWYTYDDPFFYTGIHYSHYHDRDFTTDDRTAFSRRPGQTGDTTGTDRSDFEDDATAS